MKRSIVSVDNKNVHIPFELFVAMDKPKTIRIIPLHNTGATEIEKYHVGQFKNAENRIKRLLYFPFAERRGHLPKLIKLRSIDERGATYINNTGFTFIHHNYFIVNYHPCYYLMPASNSSEAKSREQSWKEIKDYHEHLVAELQDENANKVSEWLARDIFKKLKGKTFLELGCGAGRNLLSLHKNIRDINTTGIDINSTAIKVAKKQLEKYHSTLLCKSIYELGSFQDKSFDVVFTCGVLMHIPHDKVIDIVKQMHRIAKIAVVHFELDGPSHSFDYHRYPRDYRELYNQIKFNRKITYQVFPPTDFRSNMTLPFTHALLISKHK